MKKYYLMGIACLMALPALAQDDYVTPQIVEEVVIQRTSAAGKYCAGQDMFGSMVYLYNPVSKETTEFPAYYIGNGNCVADNGTIVGQDMAYKGGTEMHAAIIMNGKGSVPQNLSSTGVSSLNAITSDGSRACGYMTNSGSVMFVPFITDINADGTVTKPVKLPYPTKDFFGDVPQMVLANNISDDGKTITGLVVDGSGFYMWPIIFKEDDNGKWSYTEPSASLFNQGGLTIPPFPDPDDLGPNAPKEPNVLDFMSEKELEEYLEALKTNPGLEPWDYMTNKEYQEYNQAIKDYYKFLNDYYYKLIDEYWEAIAAAGKTQMFGPNMALSPDGSKLLVMQNHTSVSGTSDDYSSSTLYLIDTNTGDLTEVSLGNHVSLVPHQVLNDGTILVWSHPNLEFIPYVTYIKRPEASEFELFTSFLETKIPEYYPWLEDTLGMTGVVGYDQDGNPIYGDYIVTGVISTSYDFSVIAGGLPSGDGLSYVFYKEGGFDFMHSGVQGVTAVPEGRYEVYNINGVKVLSTDDASRIRNLPRGIYIINGKKTAL